MFVVSFLHFDFSNTLTSNNISFGFMSDNLLFIFNHPIICKMAEYIDQ